MDPKVAYELAVFRANTEAGLIVKLDSSRDLGDWLHYVLSRSLYRALAPQLRGYIENLTKNEVFLTLQSQKGWK